MVLRQLLDFEKPIDELERRIEELRGYSEQTSDTEKELEKLIREAEKVTRDVYSKLSPWQVTQVARHPLRPYTLDYVDAIFDDFVELHGDRAFKDDPAIVGGLASIEGRNVVLIGQQKGRNTKEKVFRNFAMPHPEGYRKALRLMKLAERFRKPIITFVDTPGAYPGIGAEERGQAEAIAMNLMVMSALNVPIVCVVIGEGGSGGALALGVADRVMMFEFSTYSVISPEGCAAILWKDGTKADVAAKALKLSAEELKKLGVVDKVIDEPLGGAHRDPQWAAENLKNALLSALDDVTGRPIDELLAGRYEKYRALGEFIEKDKGK